MKSKTDGSAMTDEKSKAVSRPTRLYYKVHMNGALPSCLCLIHMS